MAGGDANSYPRSKSNSLEALLSRDQENCYSTEINTAGESSVSREFESVRISSKLLKNFSEMLRKSSCPNLYINGGSCRVSACDDLEAGDLDCCNYIVSDKIRKKNSRKEKAVDQQSPVNSVTELSALSDDLIELILIRLSLNDLMAVCNVCKKWRDLIKSSRFWQMRREGHYRTPWFFLFGLAKGGFYAGEIRALNIVDDKWFTIGGRENMFLKGRFMFSVAAVGDDIYLVGGCSKLSVTAGENIGRGSLKKHKGVLVFNPLLCKWEKAAPMKYARSSPILGVFEVSDNCSVFNIQQRHVRPKLRLGGVSDVYEDPHRFSLRRAVHDDSDKSKFTVENDGKQCNYNRSEKNGTMRLALIAVGGHGSWDEPLHTGEAYDPKMNRWVDIAALPTEFGIICSGVVCTGKFYVYSESDKLASFDLQRGYWLVIQTSQPPLRLRDYHPKLVSCKKRLFMLCVSWCDRVRQPNNNNGEKAVRKLWEIDLGLHIWKEISNHPDAPMDCNAIFVADDDKIYGLEMFKVFGQVLDFFTWCCVSNAEVKWRRVSRKHAAQEADVSSCSTKSIVVLHL